jgi:hypothetical protein
MKICQPIGNRLYFFYQLSWKSQNIFSVEDDSIATFHRNYQRKLSKKFPNIFSVDDDSIASCHE